MSDVVVVRVNVAGYMGEPVSLYAAFDHESDMLLINESRSHDASEAPGLLRITNMSRDATYDLLLSEDDLQEAIKAFFEADSLGLMVLDDAVKRHNPANKIERDGIKESGTVYRIAPEMSNAQVAVMFACLVGARQRAVSRAESMMADLMVIGGFDSDEPENGPGRDWRLATP
jgi:hypothetical protein